MNLDQARETARMNFIQTHLKNGTKPRQKHKDGRYTLGWMLWTGYQLGIKQQQQQ